MIRHYFGVNPDDLDDEEYFDLAAGATWLEKRYSAMVALGIATVFGENK